MSRPLVFNGVPLTRVTEAQRADFIRYAREQRIFNLMSQMAVRGAVDCCDSAAEAARTVESYFLIALEVIKREPEVPAWLEEMVDNAPAMMAPGAHQLFGGRGGGH